MVQGVPRSASTCWWLVDRQDQLRRHRDVRQNAFKHTYSIPARDAAERIYRASREQRPELGFPGREYARAGIAKLVPARLRDRLTRQGMRAPEDLRG